MTKELTRYFEQHRNDPYELYRWDCLIFTNECWAYLYGKNWCYDWLVAYPNCPNGVKDLGYNSTIEAVDSRLQRVLFPMDGALVALKTGQGPLGYALGISYEGQCHFVGHKGLISVPNRLITLSWIPYA